MSDMSEDQSQSASVTEDEDEMDEELEDSDDAGPTTMNSLLVHLIGGSDRGPGNRARWPRLSDVPKVPLRGEIAQELLCAATPVNKRKRCDAPSLDSGLDPFADSVRVHGLSVRSQPHADPSNLASNPGVYCLNLPSTHCKLAQQHPSAQQLCTQTTTQADSPASPLPELPTPVPGPEDCAGPSNATPPADTDTMATSPASLTTSRWQWLKERASLRCKHSTCQPGEGSSAQGEEEGGSCRESGEASGSQGKAKSGGFWRTDGGRRGGAADPSRDSVDSGHSDQAVAGPSIPPSPWSGVTHVNPAKLMVKRELGLGDVTGFSRSQQKYLQGRKFSMPSHPHMLVGKHDARCYIGQFSQDGSYFVAAYQDQRVRVFDVREGWMLRKDVRPRGVRWTVTDTCMSPNQQFLIYCSIQPVVHLVQIGSNNSPIESLANITEVHEAMDLRAGNQDGFGIWSVRWSRTGHDLIAGTNNESVYVYDMSESKVVAKARGHQDDVNAVEYLDESPNMIMTGSDDSLIKMWDRRALDLGARRKPRPVGVLVGHTEGITHLNAKGDGRYLISNSKDQTIKLWDVRQGLKSETEAAKPVTSFSWDYRWMSYPGAGYDVRHPHDASVMTYRGHMVHQTLIRAYFSPAFSTGQRFIYSGSADNAVHIWDAVTGEEVAVLQHHHSLVRDVSWHPTEPVIASVSWDGDVVTWTPGGLGVGAVSGEGRGKTIPLRQRGAQGRRAAGIE